MAKMNIDIDSFEMGNTLLEYMEGPVKEMAREAVNGVIADPLQRKEYFNMKEACKYVGISFVTLQKLEAKGLPIIHIEGKKLISKETLKTFLKSLEK